MCIGDNQPDPRQATLLEATEEHLPDLLAYAFTHLQAQWLPGAIGVDARGLDHGSGADLQLFVQPPVQVGGFEVQVRVSDFVQGPLQERLDLAIKSLADAAHLRAGDAGLLTDRRHQGLHLALRDALDSCLDDHRVERLIDPPPVLEYRWDVFPQQSYSASAMPDAEVSGLFHQLDRFRIV